MNTEDVTEPRTGRTIPAILAALKEEHWSFDKKVPLGLIFGMLLQALAGLWYIADMKKDIELLKADGSVLHARDTQASADLKDAIHQWQDTTLRLEQKLDRLIERTRK